MKTYDMPSAIRDGIISAVNDEDSSAFTIVTTAIIKMTTVFHESPSAIHVEMPYSVDDGISSAAIADKAQCDYYDSETAVTSTPSSAVSVADEATFTPVTNMTTVFNSRTVDNDFDLYFDTIFDTLPLVYNTFDYSNPYFDTIIWLMYIHLIDEYLYITGVCCCTKWVQSPEWVFPLNEWIFP